MSSLKLLIGTLILLVVSKSVAEQLSPDMCYYFPPSLVLNYGCNCPGSPKLSVEQLKNVPVAKPVLQQLDGPDSTIQQQGIGQDEPALEQLKNVPDAKPVLQQLDGPDSTIQQQDIGQDESAQLVQQDMPSTSLLMQADGQPNSTLVEQTVNGTLNAAPVESANLTGSMTPQEQTNSTLGQIADNVIENSTFEESQSQNLFAEVPLEKEILDVQNQANGTATNPQNLTQTAENGNQSTALEVNERQLPYTDAPAGTKGPLLLASDGAISSQPKGQDTNDMISTGLGSCSQSESMQLCMNYWNGPNLSIFVAMEQDSFCSYDLKASECLLAAQYYQHFDVCEIFCCDYKECCEWLLTYALERADQIKYCSKCISGKK